MKIVLITFSSSLVPLMEGHMYKFDWYNLFLFSKKKVRTKWYSAKRLLFFSYLFPSHFRMIFLSVCLGLRVFVYTSMSGRMANLDLEATTHPLDRSVDMTSCDRVV